MRKIQLLLIDHYAFENVTNELLLAIVAGENADLVSRIAHQAHVHVELHNILSLA